MSLSQGRFNRPSVNLIFLFIGGAVTVAASYLIALGLFDYQLLVGGLLTLTMLIMVIAGRTGISVGFTVWILLFFLGRRELDVTTALRFHPLMILIMGLFAVVLLREIIFTRGAIPWPIPRLLTFFSLFWLWGWVPGLINGHPWDVMLSEFLNFLILIPIFIVSAYLINNDRSWRIAVLAFFLAGILIALFGAMESHLSFLQPWLPGFLTPKSFEVHITGDGFARAPFSFFDTSIATIICAISVPMLLALWKWHRAIPLRILLLFGLAVQVYGIYISGTRAAWLMIAVMFSMTLILRLNLRTTVVAVLFLLMLAIGYRYFPEEGLRRAISPIAVIRGDNIDSSIRVRLTNYQGALQLSGEKPMGSGWGGAGWVASDFIQVTANLGVVAGLLFVACYLSSLLRIWHLYRTSSADPLIFGLLLSFVGAGIILTIDGAEVITAFIAPVWFVWAMVEIRCQQSQVGDSISALGEHG